MIVTGNVIICEDPFFVDDGPPEEIVDPPEPAGVRAARYGADITQQNPIQRINTAVSPQTRNYGKDPNVDPDLGVGGLNYCNAAILHTLINETAFDTVNPVPQYDLDRIIVVGGTPEAIVDAALPTDDVPLTLNDVPIDVEPQTQCLEYNPESNSWKVKAPPLKSRVYGNLVILPDGTLLALGGSDSGKGGSNDPQTIYYHEPERFDPGGPLDAGLWQDMAARPFIDGFNAIPRGYHNVAILLQDGTVALMGGRQVEAIDSAGRHLLNPMDSAEIYSPSYIFQPYHLKIQASTLR